MSDISQHYCGNCGVPIRQGARFCVSCGEPLDGQGPDYLRSATQSSGGESDSTPGAPEHAAELWSPSSPGRLARLRAAAPVSPAVIAAVVLVVIGAGVAGGLLATGGTTKPHGGGSIALDSTTTTTHPSTTTTTVPPTTEPVSLPKFEAGAFTGRDPSTIDFSVDAGNIVSNITWASWTTTQAIGQGTWTYDNCVPDCASGSATPYPATIVLSNPANGLFTTLTETTSGPQGRVQTFSYPASSQQSWPNDAS